MTNDRRVSVATGITFIVATVAALVAAALLPDLRRADYLAGVAQHHERLAVATLLYFVAAAASAGVAVAMYPVLRAINGTAAIGSVVARGVEGSLYAVAAVCLIAVSPLARRFDSAPAAGRASFQANADTLLSLRDGATLAGVVAFVIGATIYYAQFYRVGLLPRWLTGWGLAGTTLLLVACLSALFSNHPITGYTALVLPIAVQEMGMAAWLLSKGFTGSSRTHAAALVSEGSIGSR
jgi:hypothetical protein